MNHSDAQRLRAAALRKTTISARTALRRLVIGFAVIVATAGAATPARASADTSEFRGVNWADPRDNYAADEVVPSGLSAQDTYAATNPQEYWAEGVQSFFDLNASAIPTNGIHNEIHTRSGLMAYDPVLASLIAEFFPSETLTASCH